MKPFRATISSVLFTSSLLLADAKPGDLFATEEPVKSGAIVPGQIMGKRPDQAETPRMKAWRDLRYGLFIHWNINTFVEKESDFPSPKQYAPTAIDVDQWVRAARDAGMKYAVLTAKHNFGFCLWDSKVPWRGREFDFDVAASGNTTDVVRLFLNACKKYQIVPGLYYNFRDSHANLVDGGKGPMQAEYFELVKAHLAELTALYPECHYFWIDRSSCANAEQFTAVYELLRGANTQNIVLFNAHIARPWGTKLPPDFKPVPAGSGVQSDLFEQIEGFGFPTDIVNTEGNIRASLNPVAPFQSWQGRKYHVGYEHCARSGNGWGWFNNSGTPFPTQELFTMYQSVRRNGGNLLLNIGPAQTGRLDGQYVKTLMELKALIEPFEEQLAKDKTGQP